MSDDFPAAHSMDTRWFAVDEVGHVGIFDSGENGHSPEGARDGFEFVDALWRQRLPRAGESPWEGEELAAELGLFCYAYDDGSFDPIAPYQRTDVPGTPLHVDQLPPSLRKQVKETRLKNIDFARHELVQPLEQLKCGYWYADDRVAYLAGDGKTVRPIPGQEEKFAEFCEEFRRQSPEEAEKFIFEGPKEEDGRGE
jgi:hypothetical protein